MTISAVVSLVALNLQDQKMADHKITIARTCRTWKMADLVTSKGAKNDIVWTKVEFSC